MPGERVRRFGPTPIVLIHVLAFVGVAFWISMIASALTGGSADAWRVVVVGLVLGGAHVAISMLTSRHSSRAVVAMWVVFIGDSLLAIFVDWKAVLLVLFTVVLLALTRVPSSRAWFASQV